MNHSGEWSRRVTRKSPMAALRSTRRYARKRPQQQRSAAKVEVILEAAARVLAQHALGGFHTNCVAAAAGVSIGSLYQYFPNKAALVAALIERKQQALADAAEARVALLLHRPLEQALRGLARLAVDQQLAERALLGYLGVLPQR